MNWIVWFPSACENRARDGRSVAAPTSRDAARLAFEAWCHRSVEYPPEGEVAVVPAHSPTRKPVMFTVTVEMHPTFTAREKKAGVSRG